MIIFLICFKVSQIRSSFLADGIQVIECESREGQNFENFEFHSINLFHCETERSIVTINNCNFKYIKLYYTNDGHRSDYSFLTRFKLSTIGIHNCSFFNVTYMYRLISCEDPSGDQYLDDVLTFYSNTITNCYDIDEGIESDTLFSQYRKNEIINNSFLYKNSNHITRAFNCRDYNGCKFIGNKIKNSFVEEGSGILFSRDGLSPYPLVLSDSIFTNCQGKHGSTILIRSINYDITFNNMTFENCKNFDAENGYFILLDFNYSNAKANFVNCKFSYLETNFINGGSVGLKLNSIEEQNCTILFENSSFENLFHSNSTGGGAIQMSNILSNLIIDKCCFLNVSSNGNGGAIYFDSSKFIISISQCTFEEVSSGNYHAIYINMNSYLTATISGCYFNDCCPNNKQNTYILLLNSYDFIFEYNEISFSNPEQNCRIIDSTYLDRHCYRNNLFRNIKKRGSYESPIIKEISKDELFSNIF